MTARFTKSAFTRLEWLVALGVLVVLALLAVPYVSTAIMKERLITSVSHARFIHMAAMSMAMDGLNRNDGERGWPGDLKAKEQIATLADYVNLLVRHGYFEPQDLHLFSGPGFKVYKGSLTSGSNGVLSPAFTEDCCAFKVFLVRESDSPNTVFLESKNYTYNTPMNDAKALPFRDEFVVCRKGGDVSYYKRQQAQDAQAIGPLPGGATAESAENCLNPGPAKP